MACFPVLISPFSVYNEFYSLKINKSPKEFCIFFLLYREVSSHTTQASLFYTPELNIMNISIKHCSNTWSIYTWHPYDGHTVPEQIDTPCLCCLQCLVPERATLRLGVEWHRHNSAAGKPTLFQEAERNSLLWANTYHGTVSS